MGVQTIVLSLAAQSFRNKVYIKPAGGIYLYIKHSS